MKNYNHVDVESVDQLMKEIKRANRIIVSVQLGRGDISFVDISKRKALALCEEIKKYSNDENPRVFYSFVAIDINSRTGDVSRRLFLGR